MTRRVALLGVSGVGKSTLLTALATQINFLHLEASRLIKREQEHRSMKVWSSEALRTGPVLDNQELLVAGFKREMATINQAIVFDGHCVVDGRAGPIDIPTEVFVALGLDAICFLKAEASEILARREGDEERTRPLRTVEELEEHQSRAIAVAEGIAKELECPFALVTSEDYSALVTLVAGRSQTP